MIILRQKIYSAVDYALGGSIGTLGGIYGGMIVAGRKTRKTRKEAEEEADKVDLDEEIKRIRKIRKTEDPSLKRSWDFYSPEELDYDSDEERREIIEKLSKKDPEFIKKYRKKIAKGIYKEKGIDAELFNKVTKGAAVGTGLGLAITGGTKLAKKLVKK